MPPENVDLQVTVTWEIFEALQKKAELYQVTLSQYLSDIISLDIIDPDDSSPEFTDDQTGDLPDEIPCASRN